MINMLLDKNLTADIFAARLAQTKLAAKRWYCRFSSKDGSAWKTKKYQQKSSFK